MFERENSQKFTRKIIDKMNLLNKNLFLSIFLLILTTSYFACVSSTRGTYYKKYQNYDQAIEEYNYVLEQNPDNYAANLGLGDIYFERKQYDKASLYYDKAAQKKPKDPELRAKIKKLKDTLEKIDVLEKEGNTFFTSKDYLNAQAKYKEILNLYPDDKNAIDKDNEIKAILDKAAATFSEGATFERDANLKKAYENFNKAYDLTPYNDIYKKKMEAIKVEFEKANAAITSSIDLLNKGKSDEAISSLEERSAKDKNSDEINFYLAQAYLKTAQSKENSNEKLSNLKIALVKIESVPNGSNFQQNAIELQKNITDEIEKIEIDIEARMKEARLFYESRSFSQALQIYRAIIKDKGESRNIPECKKMEILCIIDEVIISSNFNSLPELQPTENTDSNVFKDVIIEISNETPYKLQFLYYGPDFGSYEIEPGSATDISFKPGKYKQVAKLYGKKIHLFAKENDLQKGKYVLLFYEKK
jgi:tetratricopeptide (TPR) repeat protein